MAEQLDRRIHIGIDYGTSWSKLVFRDYEAPRGDAARIVRPRDATDGTSLQFPSLVTLLDDRLWFGWEAERRRMTPSATAYTSVKVRMAMPDAFYGRHTPLPADCDAQSLAILTVLYLVQEADRAAVNYASSIGCRPRLSMTMGAPMSNLNDVAYRMLFVDVVRAASDLLRSAGLDLSDGIPRADGAALAQEALARVRRRPVSDWRTWVRSEVESALLVPFMSPAVADGLFAAIDIGAGTTDASFFRITPQFRDGTWHKHGLAIFGAHSGPPGVDAVDSALARPEEDPTALRMRENEIIGQRGVSKELSDAFDKIFGVYAESFSRAYQKDRRLDKWSPFDLFVFGGGARIGELRSRLAERPRSGLASDPRVLPLTVPPDLRSEQGDELGERGDPFIIAYGLSFIRADVPEAATPEEVPGFDPMREQPTFDNPRQCGCGGMNQDCPTCCGTGLVSPSPVQAPRFIPTPAHRRFERCPYCGLEMRAPTIPAHMNVCAKGPKAAERAAARAAKAAKQQSGTRTALVVCPTCDCMLNPKRVLKHAKICVGRK